MKIQLKQYGIALAVMIAIFLPLSVYLYFRRGYYDLYIANKIFAGTGAILLGLVLLIGPVNRLFSWGKTWSLYRKELGITAFFSILIHSLTSLWGLPHQFPPAAYWQSLEWQFIFGLTALIMLVGIFVISNNLAMNLVGYKRWWRWQYLGVRLVFFLVYLHVFLMKWPGWVNWYRLGGGPELVRPDWPGAGLLVGWFMAFVALVRVAEWLHPKVGRAAAYFSAAALPLIYVFSFWWGSQFGR